MPTVKTHKYTKKPGTNPLRAAIERAFVESKPDVPAVGVGSVATKAASTVAGGLPKWVKNKKAYSVLKALRKDPDVPNDVKIDVFREAAGMPTKGPPMFPKGSK